MNHRNRLLCLLLILLLCASLLPGGVGAEAFSGAELTSLSSDGEELPVEEDLPGVEEDLLDS